MEVITQERLKQVLSYDPATGLWTWRLGRKKGRPAGYPVDADRLYLRVTIDRTHFYLHRLAFLYMEGAMPPGDVDHVNLDKSDGRWDNLRKASRQENSGNTAKKRSNTSGFKGVYFKKRDSIWRAEIIVRGKWHNLGGFDCRAAAHFAYVVAADKHYGEFARAV